MLEFEHASIPFFNLRPLRLYPSKFTTFESARRCTSVTRCPGFQALTKLRLVSKFICEIASRSFFRNIRLTVGKSGFESIGLMRLEDLSNGRWATDVRKLDIWFNSPFIAGMNCHSVEFERLRSLFMKFPNLEAFNLYPNIYDRRYEAFINIAVNTIQSSSLERLTELELSHDYSEYRGLEEFIPMETDSETPRGGLENLRHLGLKGHFTWEKDGELELLRLIQTAVNIESLRLQYYCTGILPSSLHFITPRRLRYLQLENVDITAKELNHLLKSCKESIRYIEITANLHHGSWLQVLFWISRSLNLFDFRFHLSRQYGNGIEELEYELLQNIRDENVLRVYAHNDIQRQVNANRLAAGLIPLQRNIKVQTPPLKSVMEKAHYQELCSLPEF